MKEKQNTLYWDMAGDDQLYILTPKNVDRYLKIFDAFSEEFITWNEFKALLDDEDWFNHVYNMWLERFAFVDNYQEIVGKIQKGIDVSNEDNYKEFEGQPIHMDELMPDLLGSGYSSLGNDPGEYLYDSLPRDIVDEYIVEGTCGGPGCSSTMEYLEYGRQDEIIEELKSRGYNVVEVDFLPF